MCKALLVLSVLLLLNGCYRATLGGDVIVEETPDVRSDIQEVPDEAGEESNVQDGIEVSGDAPPEIDEDCEYATLVLVPIIARGDPEPSHCEDFGLEGFLSRIFVFQGDILLMDEILSCIDNEITVESIPPGDYEVAAVTYPFCSGLMKLTLLHPDLPVICSPQACCPPVAITASPCETITASMVFCCLDFLCYDCCV